MGDETTVEEQPVTPSEPSTDSEEEPTATSSAAAYEYPAAAYRHAKPTVPDDDSETSILQPTEETVERPLQRLLDRQPSMPPLLLPTPTNTPSD